tara:strand:- start:153 stop:362 length:210 start_codon:yes stop_codon:yes gene_type:complete
MKIGDLVTWAYSSCDEDDEPFSEHGLVIEVQETTDDRFESQTAKALIKFTDGDEAWIYQRHLEVVSESR